MTQTTPSSNSTQSFVPLAPIPGLTADSGKDTMSAVNSTTLANFFNNLYRYAIGVAAVLAVIEITWAGILIATNQDNASTVTDSKGRIANALFGLVLVLSPALVFSIINPSIIDLSLNLPPMKTYISTPSVTTSNNQTPDNNRAGQVNNANGTTYVNPSTGTSAQEGKWCWTAFALVSSTNDGKQCFSSQPECSADRKRAAGDSDTSGSFCILIQ